MKRERERERRMVRMRESAIFNMSQISVIFMLNKVTNNEYCSI